MYTGEMPYAKGHFDRVNDAVYELWTTEEVYSREVIRAHAEKWQVCPFEMCLDLSVWVDGVICDYNYAFDPNVHLKRFFGENISGDYIFLIDEAHNLVERGREMYSAEISRQTLFTLRKKSGNIFQNSPGHWIKPAGRCWNWKRILRHPKIRIRCFPTQVYCRLRFLPFPVSWKKFWKKKSGRGASKGDPGILFCCA